MNEFTKEELIILKRLTLQHVNQFRENSDCIELIDKLKSMIENYCEHDWLWPLYTSSGDLPIAGFCDECNCAVNNLF